MRLRFGGAPKNASAVCMAACLLMPAGTVLHAAKNYALSQLNSMMPTPAKHGVILSKEAASQPLFVPEIEGREVSPLEEFISAYPDVYTARIKVKGLSLYYQCSRSDWTHRITMRVETSRSSYEELMTCRLAHGEEDGADYRGGLPVGPGPNRVTIIVEDNLSREVHRRTAILRGQGILFKRRGIELEFEGEEAENFYRIETRERMADILADTNIFLDEAHRIRNVFIEWYPGKDANAGVYPFGDGIMVVDSGLFGYGEKPALSVFLHEPGHIFEGQIRDKSPEKWTEFEVVFDSLTALANNDGVDLFKLFDESEYLKSEYPDIPEDWGHPEDTPGELFASAQTVLRSHPAEFLDKVARLDAASKNRAHKETALAVARWVAQRFLEHPNCPADFLDPKLTTLLAGR